MNSISFSATGDSFITRRMPDSDPDYQKVIALVQGADVRFTNLETVIRRDEGFPAAQSGGTWASSAPEVLSDLRACGFNLMAWANNHTLDYSYGGLESTTRYLDEAEFVHAGVGRNLAEAEAIRYLETPAGRVALIAATSSFHESWIAGAERIDGPGRPGVNPLRFHTIYKISSDELLQLQRIAETAGINALHKDRVKGGFEVEDVGSVVRFGNHVFSTSGPEGTGEFTRPHEGDMRRMLKSIDEAAGKVDAVLVSIHAHESRPGAKHLPADFLMEFSRRCIDAGAHAIIGHGPHILRGIEIYKERPIFYSLGNFIFQNENVTWLPADFYEKYNLDASLSVAEVFAHRSGHGKRGLGLNPKVWQSAVARWRMSGGKLQELSLHPISLGFGQPAAQIGVPRLTDDLAPLRDLQELSRTFGTELRLDGAKAVWAPGS